MVYFYTLQWMSFHQLVYFSVSPESIAPWKLNSDLNCWHGIYNTIEKIPTHINAPTLGPKGPTDIHQPTHIPPIVSMIYTIPMNTPTDIHPPNCLHDIYNHKWKHQLTYIPQIICMIYTIPMKTPTDLHPLKLGN